MTIFTAKQVLFRVVVRRPKSAPLPPADPPWQAVTCTCTSMESAVLLRKALFRRWVEMTIKRCISYGTILLWRHRMCLFFDKYSLHRNECDYNSRCLPVIIRARLCLIELEWALKRLAAYEKHLLAFQIIKRCHFCNIYFFLNKYWRF